MLSPNTNLGPLIARAIAASEAQPQTVQIGSQSFHHLFFTLDSTTAPTGAGKAFPVNGRKLIYTRNGSSPAGRINVSLDGGAFFPLAPGSEVEASFRSVTVRASRLSLSQYNVLGAANGATTLPGVAVSLLVVPEGCDYSEVVDSKPAWSPVSLTGDIIGLPASDVAYSYFSIGTAPDAAGGSSYFPIAGLSRLRIFLDFSGSAGTPGAFTLIPWVAMYPDPTGGYTGKFFEMAGSAVSYVPGPNYATNVYRKACLMMDLGQLYPGLSSVNTVVPAPLLGFEVRDDAGTLTALTQVGLAVQGIE